jgi:hypothetical protein
MGRTSHTTPASQCAAVVAALIGAVALTFMALSGHAAAAATSATPSGPPRYYADVEGSTIVVRATATGTITSQENFHEGVIQALAAAGDDRTFYYVIDDGSAQQIMRFRITAAGGGGVLRPEPERGRRPDRRPGRGQPAHRQADRLAGH